MRIRQNLQAIMIQYLNRVISAASAMFILLGISSPVSAQEVRFKTRFEPEMSYVFRQVLDSTARRKMKIEDIGSVSVKIAHDTELTFAMKVKPVAGGKQKAELVFERVRGSRPGLKRNISYDTESKEIEDDDPSDIKATIKNSYKSLIGKPRELSFDEEGRLIGDLADDTNADVPLILSLNWGGHFVRFMTEGLPEKPISPGFRWTEICLIPVGGFGNVSIKVEYTFDGMRNVPGDTKRLAVISYAASLDKETESKKIDRMVGIGVNMQTNVTKMRVNGSLYFDQRRKVFTKHVRAIDFELASRSEDGIEIDEKIAEKYSTDLISASSPVLIAERVWSNAEGKKLTAALSSVEAGIGKFRQSDGREFDYKILNLSGPDQKMIADALKGLSANGE